MDIEKTDLTFGVLKRALDVTHMRGRVISENLANAETPGYKARSVDFAKAMNEAESSASIQLNRSNARHIDISSASKGVNVDKSDEPARADGNNVDQEIEIINLSENTIIYNSAAEILSRKLKLLRFSIDEGGI